MRAPGRFVGDTGAEGERVAAAHDADLVLRRYERRLDSTAEAVGVGEESDAGSPHVRQGDVWQGDPTELGVVARVAILREAAARPEVEAGGDDEAGEPLDEHQRDE